MKSFVDLRENKVDSKVHGKLKKVTGLTKQQLQMLATMPTPVLTQLVNQLGMIVSQKEEVKEHNIAFAKSNAYVGASNDDLEESPLVMTDSRILDSILAKLKSNIEKIKNDRDQLAAVQRLAKMAGYGVTKAKQTKGKTYRWDLKK